MSSPESRNDIQGNYIKKIDEKALEKIWKEEQQQPKYLHKERVKKGKAKK